VIRVRADASNLGRVEDDVRVLGGARRVTDSRLALYLKVLALFGAQSALGRADGGFTVFASARGAAERRRQHESGRYEIPSIQ
jgi:hypothetical protein